MSGAIPRSLMTDAELRAHAHDTGEDDLFVPTAAGRASAFLPPERVEAIYRERAHRERRQDLVFLGCCVAATLAWIAALTIAVSVLLGEVPA